MQKDQRTEDSSEEQEGVSVRGFMEQQVVGSNPTSVSTNVHTQPKLWQYSVTLNPFHHHQLHCKCVSFSDCPIKTFFHQVSRHKEKLCLSSVCILQRSVWSLSQSEGSSRRSFCCLFVKTSQTGSFRGCRAERTHSGRKHFRSDSENRPPGVKTSSLPAGFVRMSSCETRMMLVVSQLQFFTRHYMLLYWSGLMQRWALTELLLPSALRVKCTVMFQLFKHRMHL